MGHSSDAHIAQEAHQTARHMLEDIHSGKPNGLERAIDEINSERQTHTPAQYRQYMAELNKDIQRVLPDMQIIDASNFEGIKSLSINQRRGPRHLDKDDGRDMRIEIAYQAMLGERNRGHQMVPGTVLVKEHK